MSVKENKDAPFSLWNGYYFDPNHGGTLRTVQNTAIRGVYGSDEPRTGKTWEAKIQNWKPITLVDVALLSKHHPKLFDHVSKTDFKKHHSSFYMFSVVFTNKIYYNPKHKTEYVVVFDPFSKSFLWDDGNIWKQMIVGTLVS